MARQGRRRRTWQLVTAVALAPARFGTPVAATVRQNYSTIGRSTRSRTVRRLGIGLVLLSVLLLGPVGLVGAAADPVPGSGGDELSSVGSLEASEDDETVVVRLEDDHVVTESGADETPVSSKHVTTSETEDKLVVEDGIIVTESGHDVGVTANESDNDTVVNPVRTVVDDPNLIVTDDNVVNDTLVVNENNGLVQTAEGNTTIEANGEPIVYDDYDTTTFDPTIDDDDFDSVGEGLNLTGSVEVENLDYGNSTKNVTLELIDDDEDDPIDTVVENITLDRGESDTVTFDYGTVAGDHTADRVRVSSDGYSNQTPITIHQAETAVEIVDAAPPEEGADLDIEVEVERYGNYPRGEQDFVIALRVGQNESETEHIESKAITLDPGGNAVETFTYETQEGDSPDVYAEIRTLEGNTDNEVTSKTVPVLGEALHRRSLETTITDRNWPDEGEELVIEGLLEYSKPDQLPNDGKEYDLELYVDGDETDNTTVSLDPDTPFATHDFVYQTEAGDAPRVDVRLESPGDAATAQPRINGSGYQVDIREVNAPVNESETLVAIASIDNVGDSDGVQDVRMRIDDAITESDRTSRTVEDNATVSLDAGEATTERFTYETDSDDVPEVEVAIISQDDEATEIATVRDSAPRFEVQETTAESDGDRVTLSSTINNTGTEPGEQYVEFFLDDDSDPAYVDWISLDPWESQTLTSTVEAPETDGTYDVSVVTDNVTEHEISAVTVDRDGDDDPAEPAPDDQDDDSDDEGAVDEPDDGLPWYLIVLGTLGVLASVLVLLVYRNDPENFPPDAAALSEQASRVAGRVRMNAALLAAAIRSGDADAIVAAIKSVIGLGSGVLVVQNELPRETVVRVRCQTADDTVLLEDLELAPDERRDLGSLPDVDQFKIGAGVEDITAHEEVFQGITGDVGVVLRAEGILIANFD